MSENYDYDAIIIGAGIGGLVCGCYLAKAGLKTLIVEKNTKAGGYCSSFASKGFHFDACAHAISSLRKGGVLNKVLNHLGLNKDLEFNRPDPTEVIITPKHNIKIYHDYSKTIKELQNSFPSEARQIEEFFKFSVLSTFARIAQLKNKTFAHVLYKYFNDEELIAALSTAIFLISGTTSAQISAVVACLLIREFIFDGGYYPIKGMQGFSDALLRKFEELGGKVLFSRTVKKILVEYNSAKGILLKSGEYIYSKLTVAACDAREALFEMVGKDKLPNELVERVNSSAVSSSVFILYLGIDKSFDNIYKLTSNYYILNTTNPDVVYSKFLNSDNDYFAITSSTYRSPSLSKNISISIATNALYKGSAYWNEFNKNRLADTLIKRAEKVFPGLSRRIAFKGIATPYTLHKWTSNNRGAAFGWASTPDQFGDPLMTQKTVVRNLFLSGHWSNLSSGISLVANCAAITAGMALKQEGK